MDQIASNPNRTRDHLANERTFLAWVRTALGLIGLGFVLARMGLFLRQLATAGVGVEGKHLHSGYQFMEAGVVLLVLGTALGGFSGWLYRRTHDGIESGRYEPARQAVAVVTGLVVVSGLVIVGLVLFYS